MRTPALRLGRVVVIGRGKVGSSLAAAASRAGIRTRALSARSFDERVAGHVRADLTIIAARDGDIERVAGALSSPARLPNAVVHCAGALGVEALAALASRGVATGAMHPLLSFPRPLRPDRLRGAALVISGSAPAIDLARALARRLAMRAVVVGDIDRVLYHAIAALVANGTSALAFAGAEMLGALGLEPAAASTMLGPLVASVGANVSATGAEAALSGPVRRGDHAAVEKHLAALDRARPEIGALYRKLVQIQVPMAGLAAEKERIFAALTRVR